MIGCGKPQRIIEPFGRGKTKRTTKKATKVKN